MITLDSTLKSLEIKLAGAVTTNELTFICSYVDITTTTFLPIESDGLSNGVTAVAIMPAPAASTQRQLKFISIYNNDTVDSTVILQLNDNGTKRIIGTFLLAAGYYSIYNLDSGFSIFANNGVLQSVGVASTGPQGPIGPTGASGSNGTIGTNGATGATGATGSSGSAGATGATGSAGATGATGSAGSNGATGATGSDGSNGATGATGSDGSNGATGATGGYGLTYSGLTNSVAYFNGATSLTSSTLLSFTTTQGLSSRITKRVVSTSSTTNAVINIDTTDVYYIYALSTGVTFSSPTYSNGPTEAQPLTIRIKDNGSTQSLFWVTGVTGSFRSGSDLALPTSTIPNKTIYAGLLYNDDDSRYDLVALINNI